MQRLFFYIFFLLSFSLSAQVSADKEISFSAKEEAISEALFRLSMSAEMNITFSPKLFSKNKKVNISAKEQPLKIVLRDCLAGTNVGFKISDGSIVLFKKIIKKHILSGYLSDAQTGERLIGANIIDLHSLHGGASNTYGFYSQKFVQGAVKLQVSYLGYQTQIVEIDLLKSRTFDIELQPALMLQEVLVISKKDSIFVSSTGQSITLPLDNISKLPRAMGEADVIRYLQMLPGVQGGADGFGGLHVRGGNSDQNLILLDDVPVYNPSHTFGLFSIFNPDLAKSVQFYKAGFPARYDGRVSSVLDVRTREGNSQKFAMEASVGTMATKGVMEIPLSKGKGGILFAYRNSHINLWLNPLTNRLNREEDLDGQMNYAFRDLNIKFHHSLGKKDKIYLSRYQGSDSFQDTRSSEDVLEEEPGFSFTNNFSEKFSTYWGNQITSLRWNHLYNDRLFSNTTVTFSEFLYFSDAESKFETSFSGLDFAAIQLNSNSSSTIKDYSFRTDFDYFLNEKNRLRFGGNMTHRVFIPGLSEVRLVSDNLGEIQVPDISSFGNNNGIRTDEFNVYAEDEYQSGNWKLNAGLHLSTFVSKERKDFIPQPRLSAAYTFNERLFAKTSATRTAQFLHLITRTDSGLPNDLWVPAGERTPPQKSWQFATGLGGKLGKDLHWNTEIYYKTMDNVLRLNRDSLQTSEILTELNISADNREDYLEKGTGNAYGFEAKIERNTGKLTGWLGYSFAVTNRFFNGVKMPYIYDSRHGVTFATVYHLRPHINVSANWICQSGLPVSDIELGSRDLPFSSVLRETTIVPDKNNRLPAYHRLDVGVNFNFGKNKWKHNLHLGVYNIYNRKNVFFANPQRNFQTQEVEISAVYSLPILPSFSYGIKF